ncbi:MAG: CAP domain-containing protein [Sphingomicrobium sp.]
MAPRISSNCRPVLAFLAAALVASSSSSQSQPAQDDFAARLLQAHNSERTSINSSPLAWDPALARAAADYAAELAATDKWGHSAPDQRINQGENLWMGSRGGFSLEQMISNWASEKSMFRAGIFPHVSTTGNWHDVGHYVQIVWPGTHRVGCGRSSSERFDYLVCRYADPGNVMGEVIGHIVKVADSPSRLSSTKL